MSNSFPSTAAAFWDKAIEMKESGSNRKPGMSVEGKALERDKQNPNKVIKALITNVALTMTPVNTKTYVDIEKSKESDVLFEKVIENRLVQINKSFELSVREIEGQKNLFREISEGYREGTVSKRVFLQFLEGIK